MTDRLVNWGKILDADIAARPDRDDPRTRPARAASLASYIRELIDYCDRESRNLDLKWHERESLRRIGVAWTEDLAGLACGQNGSLAGDGP